MKRVGRPPKKINISDVSNLRPSAFDLKKFGINPDPAKDYRWSTPDRVEEHKHMHGYQLRQAKEGEKQDESGHARTKGNMVLMERPRSLAQQSQARKILRTEQRTRAVRDMTRTEVEKLSSKHGVDLHKVLNHLERDGE
ncbi:MAG: hypothetical protein ACYTEU_09240 [Planctomycetota bacterium]|jgi:hypothetical protein